MKQITPKRNAKGWTSREIRAQLVLLGITQLDIAKAEGLTQQAIGMAIQGARQGLKARKAVAKALGKPVEEIWPDALLPVRERRRLRCAS